MNPAQPKVVVRDGRMPAAGDSMQPIAITNTIANANANAIVSVAWTLRCTGRCRTLRSVYQPANTGRLALIRHADKTEMSRSHKGLS